MKVYLAGMYSWKPRIRAYAEELRQLRIEITSRWLEESHDPDVKLADVSDEDLAQYADHDTEDIDRADVMVFFSVPETLPTVRGGRHVEFGWFAKSMKPIIVVGPRENIFHHKPNATPVNTWKEAVALLKIFKLGYD